MVINFYPALFLLNGCSPNQFSSTDAVLPTGQALHHVSGGSDIGFFMCVPLLCGCTGADKLDTNRPQVYVAVNIQCSHPFEL